MLTLQERTERARTAAHAMWARIHSQLRDPDPNAAQDHLDAAEVARRRLALLRAERAVTDAQRAADDAAARLAELSS
jgi:hypothetical protein